MTNNEFKNFLNSLEKTDLIKIILDQTKDNPNLQEEIFLTYSPELTITPADFRKFRNKMSAISRKIFDPEYIHLKGLELDKYCELYLDLIKTQIEPLVKRGMDYDAYNFLVELYFNSYNELERFGSSIPTTVNFLNKVRRGLQQIAERAKPIDKFKIEKLINDKITAGDTFWYGQSLFSLIFDLGNDWIQERNTILTQMIDQFMNEMDFSQPAPDDFSLLALLLLLNIEDTGTEEELNDFLEKYKFLGDVIRYKARVNRERGNFLEAKKILREAKNLPTLSREQLRLNSNFLIETMLLERGKKSEDQQIPTLLAELKENLDNYEQDTIDNLMLYLLYVDQDQIDDAYLEYKDKENTKYLYDAYTGNYVETLALTIKALKNKDYAAQIEYMDTAFPVLSRFEPKIVADFLTEQIKLLAAEEVPNYSQIGNKVIALWTDSNLNEYYQELKSEFKKKYPRDKKLKMIFDEAEKSVRI